MASRYLQASFRRTMIEPTRAPAKASMGKTAAAKTADKSDLGALPEWDLADLYPDLDSAEVRRDLERSDAECSAFEEA
jgi:oligoendopeptidase F